MSPTMPGLRRARRLFTVTTSRPSCFARALLKISLPRHGGLLDELPPRIKFDETLRRCRAKDLLTDDDVAELRQLVGVRNPLTHFRNVDDAHNLDRRSMATGRHAGEILSRDAWFAITLAARILAKEPFGLVEGSSRV